MLQKLEAYEGIAILATNLKQHVDDAFLRRFSFTVRFPLPDEAGRRQIWAKIWPPEVPLDKEINFNDLASRFRLSGGNIRNAALAAAFFAAEAGNPVKMEHLLRGIESEYQKVGKSVIATTLSSELGKAAEQ